MNTAIKLEQVPSLRMIMRRERTEFKISSQVYNDCASYIRDHADEAGDFTGNFLIEEESGDSVDFKIDCRLIYTDNIDGRHCSDVIFYDESRAETYDQDGEIPNDFNESKLLRYILN